MLKYGNIQQILLKQSSLHQWNVHENTNILNQIVKYVL